METMVGALAVSVVLILALYGVSQLLDRAGERLLYPRHRKAKLVLYLDDAMTDAEWQIRASQHIAAKGNIPFCVVDRTTDDDVRCVAEWLLSEGGGELVTEIPFEKMLFGSCGEQEDCV